MALLERQDEHTAMRMAEKKVEKERKEAAAVGDAICFCHVERAQTVAALDSLLRRKKSGQAAIELLLRQTRLRTVGCAVKDRAASRSACTPWRRKFLTDATHCSRSYTA